MNVSLNLLRWLPLTILAVLALSFEPLRSGFVFADQGCELITGWERMLSGIYNPRHIISFGVFCLIAAMTLRQNRILIPIIGTFLFSILLENEQRFLATGHCRAWDLIPNILGIGIAVIIFILGIKCINWSRNFKSKN